MWLTRIDGIGERAHRLLEHFSSAEAVWRAEPSAIRRSAIQERLTEGLPLSGAGASTENSARGFLLLPALAHNPRASIRVASSSVIFFHVTPSPMIHF